MALVVLPLSTSSEVDYSEYMLTMLLLYLPDGSYNHIILYLPCSAKLQATFDRYFANNS